MFDLTDRGFSDALSFGIEASPPHGPEFTFHPLLDGQISWDGTSR